MARIRSLHPGQWTDEDFVAVSFAARLLALALRNEADDNGVFEWKPIALKMRLFPADDVNLIALLGELEAADLIRKAVYSGKDYGLIRNFRRWQRPEKPKAIHPIDDEGRRYVALVGDKSPKNADQASPIRQPVADRSPKVVSEEGGRREEERGASLTSFAQQTRAREDAVRVRLALVSIFGENETTLGWSWTETQILLDAGFTETEIVMAGEKAKASGVTPRSLAKYLRRILDDMRGTARPAAPKVVENDPLVENWKRRKAEKATG